MVKNSDDSSPTTAWVPRIAGFPDAPAVAGKIAPFKLTDYLDDDGCCEIAKWRKLISRASEDELKNMRQILAKRIVQEIKKFERSWKDSEELTQRIFDVTETIPLDRAASAGASEPGKRAASFNSWLYTAREVLEAEVKGNPVDWHNYSNAERRVLNRMNNLGVHLFNPDDAPAASKPPQKQISDAHKKIESALSWLDEVGRRDEELFKRIQPVSSPLLMLVEVNARLNGRSSNPPPRGSGGSGGPGYGGAA